MGALGLALRAVWWRRGVSLVVLAIASFVAAAAASGPVYLRAAGESILRDRLAGAPAYSIGVEARAQGPAGAGFLARLAGAVRDARAGVPYLPGQIGALEIDTSVLAGDGSVIATTRLTYREGACDRLVVKAGRCPAALGQVAVSEAAARDRGWRLGDVLELDDVATGSGPRLLTISALYEPRDVTEAFWFGRRYFLGRAALNPNPDETLVDAFFVPEATFAGLAAGTTVRAVVSMPLDVGRVRLATADDAEAGVVAIRDRMARSFPDAGVESGLSATVAAARRDTEALRTPVLLIVLQLLVLSWFVLFMVVASSAEARGGEVALAKARGLPPGATAAFGLLETLLLLLAGIPLGLLLGRFGVELLARSQLLDGTPVRLVPVAAGGAAVAALGGLVAAAMAAWRTLRTPVLDLWRRAGAGRQGGSRGWAVDVGVLTLAGAGLAQLWFGGTLREGRTDVVALVAPGLLALGVALAGARLVPLACRSLFPVTRGSRRLGLFLGLRQVARRPAGLRVVVILTIAFGLSTFSVVGWSVAARNRSDRALAETGAYAVLGVDTDGDLLEQVRAADPTGRYAMAVVMPEGATSSQQLIGVDSERYPRVAFWRSDFARAPVAELARKVKPPAPPPVEIRGDGVGVRVSVTRLAAGDPVTLVADLQRPDGRVRVPLGTVVAGTGEQALRAAVTGCAAAPCRLVALRLDRPASGVAGSVLLTRIEQRSGGTWTEAAPGVLADAGRWRSLNNGDYAPPDTLFAGAAGLRFDVSAPRDVDVGLGPLDVPEPLPAVAARALLGASGSRTAPVAGLGSDRLVVEAVDVVELVPRAGRNAALVDLEYLNRASFAPAATARREVWLAEGAPASVEERLRAAGVRVTDRRTAADREDVLGRQAPALALLLFLVGAGIAAVLAAGGTVLNVYLLGRRRAYELAAMRAVGVPRRGLLAGVLVEQVLLLGSGTLLGVATGLAGARLALRSVPLYSDAPAFPPALFDPSPALVALLVGAVVGVMTLAILLAGAVLVRSASPTRLREAQA